MADAERDVRQVLERLHTAMNRVAAGDVSEIKALYSHRDDATAFFGWGGYEKGWDQVSARWDWAARQFKGGGPVTHEVLTMLVADGLAVTIEIETFRSQQVDGMETTTEWSNRVTHVFRWEDGEWRLVHRHANRLENRYRPGTRLR